MSDTRPLVEESGSIELHTEPAMKNHLLDFADVTRYLAIRAALPLAGLAVVVKLLADQLPTV